MSTTTTRIPVGTFASDPVHTRAGFRVRHFGLAWLPGHFEQFEVELRSGDDGSLQLRGEAPVASISFTNEQLKGHLMSPDFFDEQLHPKIAFESSDVELADDGTATVRGDLSIKGITRPIELAGTWAGPTEGLGGDERIALELTGEFDRMDHDVSWQAQLPGGADVAGRIIRLEGAFELVRQ